MAAWHDSDVRPDAVKTAVFLAVVDVLLAIVLWRVLA